MQSQNLMTKRVKIQMDNLFQVLIFLFIIYTIFGSAFKKKKTDQRKFPQSGEGEDHQQSSPKPKYQTTDILQDLFGMKIPKTEGEYEDLSQNKYSKDYETDLPDIEKQVELAGGKINDINYDKLSTDELQQKMNWDEDSSIAYESFKSISQRTLELQRKIKNPRTLKELFLISEIINKPKSLRR